MLIETISGHETFAGGYETRIILFYRNTATEPEKPLAEALKYGGGVSQIGSVQNILACEANRNHGQWTIGRYAVRERSFIEVVISKKLPGSFIRHTKRLMLHNREQAALRRITLPFSGHQNAALESGHVEGKFDILTLPQMLEIGLPIEAVADQYDFSDEDMTDFYIDRIIEPEKTGFATIKQETVTTETGKSVRIAKPRRRVIVPR